MTPQQKAIAKKLKEGKVKNRYAAKGKIKKIQREIDAQQRSVDHFKWLAQ